MDSIPPKDFVSIFHRMNAYVDLKDCKTPGDIRRRIRIVIEMMRIATLNAKKQKNKKKWSARSKLMVVLMDDTSPVKSKTAERKKALGKPVRRAGIQDAIIEEAIRHPSGLVALTLKHGYEKAMKGKLETPKGRVGVMTIHKRGKHK